MRLFRASVLLVWTLLAVALPAQSTPPAQTYVANIGSAPFKAPVTSDFALSANLTLEGWFFLTGASPYAWMMGKCLTTGGVDPYVSFALLLGNDGAKPVFATSTGTPGSYREIVGPAALPLRTWVHIAAVMENGTTTRLLINGQVVATGTAAGAPVSAPSVPLGVGVAYLGNGDENYPRFPGLARHVRVWNVARTQAQIAASLGESLPSINTGLVAAWPLDEKSGASARDISGNSRALATHGNLVSLRTSIVTDGPFYGDVSTPVSDGSLSYVNEGQLIDFDHDGDLDVVLMQVYSPPTVPETRLRLRAFRNNSGTFVDATDAVLGTITMTHPRHHYVADFNRDGRPDLLIVGHGTDTPPFPGEQAKLLIQSSDGRLVDESAARLPAHSSFTHNVAAGDIDGDGDTDIYMCNVFGGDSGPRFYLNNGTGVFTEAVDRIPADINDRTYGSVFTSSLLADVNGDSFPDLVLGGENTAGNELLLNDGAGYFTRNPSFVLPTKLVDATATTVAIATADFNGDSKPDLLLATTGGTVPLPDGRTINGYGIASLQLLLNRGDGKFTDATPATGFIWKSDERWVVWSRIFDCNDDGWPDILATVNTDSGMKPRLFLNLGTEAPARFLDISELYQIPQIGAAFLHAGDFDRDGKMDLISAGWGHVTVARRLKAVTAGLFAEAPSIVTQPASQTQTGGSSVTFRLGAIGYPLPSYQWRKNGVDIPGATGPTLTLPSNSFADTGVYSVVLTSSLGRLESDPWTLTISDNYPNWLSRAFTPQEISDTSRSGATAKVAADGLPNLVRYALGFAPSLVATGPPPIASVTPNDWVFLYTRPAGVTDVVYTVEASTDMTNWSANGVTHELVSSSAGIDQWRARYPRVSTGKVFFRLRVVR